MNFDVKKDFPILEKYPDLIYFDSACTSLKPKQVIDEEMYYYKELGACGSRSSHFLGRRTSEKVEESREKVLEFLGASGQELVFTKNATEGLNIVINGLDYSKRNKIVTTIIEHHAVLLPLMKLRDEEKIKLEILMCNNEGKITLEQWKKAIDKNTALVLTNNSNNTTGFNQNTKEIAKIAHENGALVCIDGAQGVAHHKTEFSKDNYDFICFSGHKMLGPNGIGGLVCKKEKLKELKPFVFGGGTVKTVSLDKVEYLTNHEKFEAGVQNYSGIIGLASACEYLKKLGMEDVEKYEKDLAKEMQQVLQTTGATVYGSNSLENHSALFSFNLKGAKAHDITLMLDQQKIAVRSGFFCAQPAMQAIGAKDGAVRVSCYVYNTEEEIRNFGEALNKLKALY